MAVVVQVYGLVRGGMSVSIMGSVSMVDGGMHVVDSRVVCDGGNMVDGSVMQRRSLQQRSAMVQRRSVMADGSMMQWSSVQCYRVDWSNVDRSSLGVVDIVMSMSLAGYSGLESVSVILVVHNTTGAIGLN